MLPWQQLNSSKGTVLICSHVFALYDNLESKYQFHGNIYHFMYPDIFLLCSTATCFT